MVPDDWHHGIGKLDGAQDGRALHGVFLHRVVLASLESARLVQHVIGHAELAHVVQQRGRRECFELALVGYPEGVGESEAVTLHAADVTVRDLVLDVNRDGQRLDRGLVQMLEVANMARL